MGGMCPLGPPVLSTQEASILFFDSDYVYYSNNLVKKIKVLFLCSCSSIHKQDSI